ncbi:MAG TPA: hypothetical protein VGF28_14405 [Thermoanaerobaculia bacterium]|jgi:hypothetical protein
MLKNVVLVCLLAVPSLFAQESRVEVYDGTVSFVPPEGYSRLSEEIVARKFPAASPGTVVYSNARTTHSISITHPPQRALKAEDLPEFKPYMESMIEAQSKGIEWLKKEIVQLGDRKWVHLEFISQGLDMKIHNDFYLTSRDDRMLAFNFNAPAAGYETPRKQFDAVRGTIRLQ